MKKLTIQHPTATINGSIELASSKSESNRALVISALSEGKSELYKLANARDTQTMQRLLASPESETWDVLDAGTTMRFLTAYATIQGGQKTMTGSARMQERPIKLLVDALRSIGADITYKKNEGYPPFKINQFRYNGNRKIEISGEVSSQYISALLMIAPCLPEGLEIELTGKVGSKPYIQMTLNLMEKFGASYHFEGNKIQIDAQKYNPTNYTIEADWSGASYWYSIVALSKKASLTVNGLREESNQGDSVLVELMSSLGVKTTFTDKGVHLEKTEAQNHIEWDFTHCPDIAQTIAVICAAKGISAKLTGLESLRIKETDRIEAIKNELKKFDVDVQIEGDEVITLDKPILKWSDNIVIKTYEDHRMAMAFAPLALLGQLEIEEPDVVNKSYPDFWRDLKSVGFEAG